MNSREQFEAVIKAPPYEHLCERMGKDSAWPDQYMRYETQLAWEFWQHGREGLQAELAEVRAESARLREALDTLYAVVGLTPVVGNREALQEAMDNSSRVLAGQRCDHD